MVTRSPSFILQTSTSKLALAQSGSNGAFEAGAFECTTKGLLGGRAVACTLEIWVACALEIMVACTLDI